MTDEYKRALYDAFLKDVVPYESVTDEQFQHLAQTFVGTRIGLNIAWDNLIAGFAEAFKPAIDAMKKVLDQFEGKK